MELTQIQGQNVGTTTQVPQGAAVPLQSPTQSTTAQNPANTATIQNQGEQKIVTPHPEVPVAVNGQTITTPTAVQHGDTVSIHPNTPKAVHFAVHRPDHKLDQVHVGDFVKKAGLNLKEDQVLAIVQEIENAEKKKLIIIAGGLGAIILGLIVTIGLLWMNLSDSQSDLTKLQTNVNKVKNQVEAVEEAQAEMGESEVTLADLENLAIQLEAIEEKITAAEEAQAELDASTQAEMEELLSKFQQYSTEVQGLDSFEDRIKFFEEILQTTPLGQQLEQAGEYEELQVQCGENECCLNSLQTMINNSYKLAENNSCPVGEKINRLQCLDSYVWCVPELGSSAAVEGVSEEEINKVLDGAFKQFNQ